MLRRLADRIGPSVGIEPTLTRVVEGRGYALVPGRFPGAVPDGRRFDLISMLAVIEHLPATERAALGDACDRLLSPGGRIVVTVPSPRVDAILHVLIRLRLVDGMEFHEHHGFKPEETPKLFAVPSLRLALHRRFQLGLNNLFVFEKAPTGSGAQARS